MTRQLTVYEKEKVIEYFNDGALQKNIAKHFKISQAAVSKIIKRYNERNYLERKTGSGRKKILNSGEILNIRKKLKASKNFSANDVAVMLNNKISSRSATRYLKEFGYSFKNKLSKPELKKFQKVARYRFALKYVNYSDEDWKKVIFSDETKIVLRGNDSRSIKSWIIKGEEMKEKNLNLTNKFSKLRVDLWGCMSYHGVGNMEFYNGTINGSRYIGILARNLIPSVKKFKLKEYIFQQDGASSHTCKDAMDYFLINEIELLDWPSNSPDLNPIEHLWAIIKQKLRKMDIRTIDELKKKTVEAYNSIPKEHIQNLILSMKDRIMAVINAKGGNTRY